MQNTNQTDKTDSGILPSVRVDSVKIEWLPDDMHDSDLFGCVAKAEVSYSIGNGSRRLEWLTSSGIWGVEYGDEAEMQLDDLAEHLGRFGIKISAKQLAELA